MRKIKITFETVTPESAAEGDAADRGWIDEEGVSIEPDELDIEDNDTELNAVVALAVKEIGGCVEPSSSQWHQGVWYTEIDPDRDYQTGAETRKSFHLYGFSKDEERAIFSRLTSR